MSKNQNNGSTLKKQLFLPKKVDISTGGSKLFPYSQLMDGPQTVVSNSSTLPKINQLRKPTQKQTMKTLGCNPITPQKGYITLPTENTDAIKSSSKRSPNHFISLDLELSSTSNQQQLKKRLITEGNLLNNGTSPFTTSRIKFPSFFLAIQRREKQKKHFRISDIINPSSSPENDVIKKSNQKLNELYQS